MPRLQGIVIYTIGGDGHLNGSFTKNGIGKSHDWYNEIAKKKTGNASELEGEYVCSWVGKDDVLVIGELHIARLTTSYHLEWWVDGVQRFEGTGILTEPDKLTVAYMHVK